jgi:hypothetical protein
LEQTVTRSRQRKASIHLFAGDAKTTRAWHLGLSLLCLAPFSLSNQWANAQNAANIQMPSSNLVTPHIKSPTRAATSTPTPSASSSHALPESKPDPSPYVKGTLYGQKFALSKAFYNAHTVFLKSASVPVLGDFTKSEASPGIRINFATNQRLEGKSYRVVVGQDHLVVGEEVQPKPKLELDYLGGGSKLTFLDTIEDHSPYSMTLNFYKQQNGMLPGFIDLDISAAQKTRLKGYFWAVPGQ